MSFNPNGVTPLYNVPCEGTAVIVYTIDDVGVPSATSEYCNKPFVIIPDAPSFTVKGLFWSSCIGSFIEFIVIVKIWIGLVSSPPFAVPPSSFK